MKSLIFRFSRVVYVPILDINRAKIHRSDATLNRGSVKPENTGF